MAGPRLGPDPAITLRYFAIFAGWRASAGGDPQSPLCTPVTAPADSLEDHTRSSDPAPARPGDPALDRARLQPAARVLGEQVPLQAGFRAGAGLHGARRLRRQRRPRCRPRRGPYRVTMGAVVRPPALDGLRGAARVTGAVAHRFRQATALILW